MVIGSAVGDELTPQQRCAVEHRGGNLLVEAVPGSGKTRVIVARALALLAESVPPQKILVLTFSRRAVGELQRRLARAAGTAAIPEVRTFHGFAARLLAEAGEGGRSRRLLSEPAERALFEHVVATTPLPSLPDGVATSPLFRTAAATVVDDLRRATDDARAQLASRATPRLTDLLALVATQQRLRDRLGVADFDDLIARAARLAATADSAVAKALDARYLHVLVDEFQDTDPAQFALLERLGGEIFAVGDAAQAIYGFRGAARDAMHTALTRLSMHRLPLAESFRCPREICELARSAWSAAPAFESRVAAAGEIAYRRAATPHDEASFIADRIAEALASGTPANEIAVLVRSAEPLAPLIDAELRARAIAATRQGGENVLDDPCVDAIGAMLGAFAQPANGAAWVRLFAHPAFGLDALALRLALAANQPVDVTSACVLAGSLPANGRIPGGRFAAALRAAHDLWLRNEPVRAARAFAFEADLLGYAIDGDEDRARASARRIEAMLDGLGDVRDVRAKLGLDVSSAAVVAAFRTAGASWRADGPDDETGDGTGRVSILTIHAAKGLEFDVVIVADAIEGHFPQTWRSETLTNPDEIALARGCGVDLGTLANEHDDEERSLWYVAVTRAKRRVLVTWSETDAEGTPLRPSRFVPLDDRTRESERASHRGPLRYLAAPELADPQPATPARLTRPLRTSAMDKWFSCRRQFYYEALLKVGSEERGFAAKLGTLVHRAIATFHDSVRDFRAVAADAHVAWMETLRELARALVATGAVDAFESPLETEAALRASERMMDRYARHLESRATSDGGAFEVVATEAPVDYHVGGIHFSGRIDRVDERADGSLELVDIKTGKLKGEMLTAYSKLADALAKESLWVKATPPANPQLPLYRHAKPGTSALAYLYLGAPSKFGKYADTASDDRLAITAEASDADRAALAAIDAVLTETFFTPWTSDAITTLEPTAVTRTCRYCDFVTICPGFQEDDD